MSRTPLQKLGLTTLGITGAVVFGCLVYLFASGTRPGAPMVFVVAAAIALCVTLYLLARSAIAVMVEPQTDEVRIATGRRRKELEREKQLLLKALKELAFDREMHKVSDADYEDIAGTYRARAVRIMRQLDEGAQLYRLQISEELATRREKAPAATGRSAVADTPPETAKEHAPAVAAAGPDEAAADRHACVHCDASNERDAVFCKKCGQRIDAEARA